jgi:signal transduction histidine kinase
MMAAGMLAGGVVGGGFMPWAVTAWLAMVVMLFQLGLCYGRRTTVGAGLVTALVVLTPVLVGDERLWFALILWGIIVFVLLFADAVSGRNVAEASLAEQALLRQQDLARQAVLEERARIARELHDVVAHHMSVVVLQSEAAPHKIPELSGTGQRTFEVIRDAAREALSETRRVVGLLRDADESAERFPLPGLDRLEELVEGARRAGLTVHPQVLGVPRPVADGVDLAAFRIIQEALSNAARYAPGSMVEVGIQYGADQLVVSVADGGAVTVPPSEPGGGHGLVGIRERVAMLGGSLFAGLVSDGGFTVRAALPYGQ